MKFLAKVLVVLGAIAAVLGLAVFVYYGYTLTMMH